MLSFDPITRRSDPNGLLVRFEAYSERPVTALEVDLVGDGEPSVAVTFPVDVGRDGRYIRALAFKPTVNSGIDPWPLQVTAFNDQGQRGSTICTPGVTVTF